MRRFGGSLFELPHLFFHLLARLEGNDVLLGDENLVAGSWIAGFSCRPLLDFENAEIAQFDPAILNQRLDNRVEGLLDDLLGLQLRHSDFIGNGFDDFFFSHDSVLPREATSSTSESTPWDLPQRASTVNPNGT